MIKRKKPTKALEKCARQIKSTDEFVEHIANIADRYRREHAADSGPRHTAVRQSMREFHKHAAALTTWLQQSQKTSSTPQGDALNKIGTVLYGVPGRAQAESKSVLEWLAQADQVAVRCLSDNKLLPKKSPVNAPSKSLLSAAEALRATFDHHKLKWSAVVTKQKQSDAVRVLCAIAKSAGATLSPQQAREVLRV
jgi:hypothetical protein